MYIHSNNEIDERINVSKIANNIRTMGDDSTVVCDCGWVLFWQRGDMLCTSGFMDDVMFAINGPCKCNDSDLPGGGMNFKPRRIPKLTHEGVSQDRGQSLLSTIASFVVAERRGWWY